MMMRTAVSARTRSQYRTAAASSSPTSDHERGAEATRSSPRPVPAPAPAAAPVIAPAAAEAAAEAVEAQAVAAFVAFESDHASRPVSPVGDDYPSFVEPPMARLDELMVSFGYGMDYGIGLGLPPLPFLFDRSRKRRAEDALPTVRPLVRRNNIETGLCVICQDRRAELFNNECDHVCICLECSRGPSPNSPITQCPLCRTGITRFRFLSNLVLETQ